MIDHRLPPGTKVRFAEHIKAPGIWTIVKSNMKFDGRLPFVPHVKATDENGKEGFIVHSLKEEDIIIVEDIKISIIQIVHHDWHCSDGCCSESGYWVRLFSDKKPCDEYWENDKRAAYSSYYDYHSYNEVLAVEHAIEVMKERFGENITIDDPRIVRIEDERND